MKAKKLVAAVLTAVILLGIVPFAASAFIPVVAISIKVTGLSLPREAFMLKYSLFAASIGSLK